MNLFTLLENLLLFLALMIPGYLLGKSNLIPPAAQGGIGSILMYIAMPFLVFQKLLETDLRTLDPVALVIATVVPFLLGLALLLAAKRVFPDAGTPARTLMNRFCSFLHNCGFWGIPLAAALFPDLPEVTVYVSLVNIVNTVLLLTVGVYVLSGDVRNISPRGIVTSPVMLAIVAGCTLSLLEVNTRFPQLTDYAMRLANLAAPLSMLSLGLETARLSFRELFSSRDLYLTCGLKLILSPMLMMGVLFALRGIGVPIGATLLDAMFLSTAVSSASSAPAMAARYGLDAHHAAILTIGTTLLCVVTMPLLYALFTLLY